MVENKALYANVYQWPNDKVHSCHDDLHYSSAATLGKTILDTT